MQFLDIITLLLLKNRAQKFIEFFFKYRLKHSYIIESRNEISADQKNIKHAVYINFLTVKSILDLKKMTNKKPTVGDRNQQIKKQPKLLHHYWFIVRTLVTYNYRLAYF